MAEVRSLEQIRSDLRGARAFAISPSGALRFQELLQEARQACGSRDEWLGILREIGMTERD